MLGPGLGQRNKKRNAVRGNMRSWAKLSADVADMLGYGEFAGLLFLVHILMYRFVGKDRA